MKTDNLTAQEAELLLINGYKVQPIGWKPEEYVFIKDEQLMFFITGSEEARKHCQSVKEWASSFRFINTTFRLVTTDEDVAKWSDRQATTNYFKDKKPAAKQYWREEYARHLTTLPELTEGKQGETFAADKVVNFKSTTDATPINPSAPVSDEVIEEWWDGLDAIENAIILPTCSSFDGLRFSEKLLVRQAYHKAHEKVEQKARKHTSPLLEELADKGKEKMTEALQAYKFPYKMAGYNAKGLLFLTTHNTLSYYDELTLEDFNYICEAINEKRQRDGK